MIITYFGKQFFKIAYGETVLAVNPISKDSKSGEKVSRFGAQIMLSTTNHADYNGIDSVTYNEAVPISITGPGDYEARDIFIKGVGAQVKFDGKDHINTVYSFSIDNINICFLGAMTRPLAAAEREGLDILFVPVGKETLDPASAYKLAVSFEPKIIIPMDYDAAALKMFLKEAGEDKVEPVDKLTLKKKDLDGKEGDVVVLAY